ncbi:MAG: 3-hydroxyacyl-CoA dehydrogenase NAD-binding domain-containing protein [Xanthomonadales bacterium]|nr:3-hydroxyacyl-CoA dehydrogenase NAD-binding domain-containing protein [Xanthomonadales bacterium]
MPLFDGLRFRHLHHRLEADGVLLVEIDRAEQSVNTLSEELLGELEALLERVRIEPPAGLIVASRKPAGFVAGADIREFARYAEPEAVRAALARGHRVFDRLAALPCPTVAAIHGHCMGGGTELALACRYRVASEHEKTRIGLPEIRLGIFPGWGGSARLPHLIGAPAALDLMLTGRALRPREALRLGLLDRVAPLEGLLDAARELLRRQPRRPLGRRLLAWASNLWPARQAIAFASLRALRRRARRAHYPAPFKLIETWRRHGGSVARMARAEQRAVAELAATPTARNLVRVFFLQERLKALGGGQPHGIVRIHVVGAGVMGGDIAAWCALHGFAVTLQDREERAVQAALERAAGLFARRIADPALREEARARLVADPAGERVAEADLAIEAIFENLEAKRALYAELEARLRPEALLATNTSSLPLAALAEGLARPERFLGLHFFNPVPQMPLVEVVRHERLDPQALRRAAALVRAIDKLPLPVAPSTGFLVNRVLFPYLLEAMLLYQEGVPGPVIDRAARDFGMPMGPIELADQVGLDVAAAVGRILAEHLGIRVPAGLESLLAAGRLGRKSGAGFYEWREGRPVRPPVDRGYRPPEDLEDRLILPLLNETVACLAEGVVEDAELADAGVIFGTGFAPFRGGPVTYIRTVGAAVLRERLEGLAARHGPRFAPRPGWERLSG